MREEELQELYNKYSQLQIERGLTYMCYEHWYEYCYKASMGFLTFDQQKYDRIMRDRSWKPTDQDQ